MGAEFTGPMRSADKAPAKASIQYGVNGKVKSADSTRAASGKTSYIDRVSKSTVKRAS